MPVWEYKVISSGKGGFATPALLETFLNQLGKEEWEIIRFNPQPDNPLAFSGLARRPTQRDWTIEDAAATAARAEADKLRAEFAAKFREGGRGEGEEKPENPAAEKAESEGGLRRLRDTESDLDPDAPEENGEGDEWDKLDSEDELPTFFEAIRPHMRRNQRGPGLSVGVDYLAKKWQLTDDEVTGALKECGLSVPEDEDSEPAYVEYDGDLYWVNMNRRGELWINTKEKPRPMFRVTRGTPVAPETAPAEASASAPGGEEGPRPERDRRGRRQESGEGGGEPPAPRPPPIEPGQPLPTGPELLERLGPMMRRSRRGRGLSGSVGFLARALKISEADLLSAFAGLGLVVPTGPEDRLPPLEIAGRIWWLNHDQRGGVWINGDEKRASEPAAEAGLGAPEAAPAAAEPTPASSPSPASGEPGGAAPLAAVRLLLQPAKNGGVASEVCTLADALGRGPEELVSTLVAAGLRVPEKPREKPVFVEHNGEIFWFNRNAKDELWLNAKPSKFAGEDRPSRSRSRRKPAAEAEPPSSEAEATDSPAPEA